MWYRSCRLVGHFLESYSALMEAGGYNGTKLTFLNYLVPESTTVWLRASVVYNL